jgi:hypothetical protein
VLSHNKCADDADQCDAAKAAADTPMLRKFGSDRNTAELIEKTITISRTIIGKPISRP